MENVDNKQNKSIIQKQKQIFDDKASFKSNKSVHSQEIDKTQQIIYQASVSNRMEYKRQQSNPDSTKDRQEYILVDKILKIQYNELKKVQLLGQGSTSKVYLVQHTPSQQKFAIKIYNQSCSEESLDQVWSEIQILQKCESQFIIKFYGQYQKLFTPTIMIEYLDKGTLYELLSKKGQLREKIIQIIIKQILNGLQYIHQKLGYIHRDIKPQNILINSNGLVKIIDFGISTRLDQLFTYECIGTYLFMSPERLKGIQYDQKADIWSLGIIILFCIHAQCPFSIHKKQNENLDFWTILKVIETQDICQISLQYSDLFVDFLKKCLDKDQNKRYDASQLLSHPWITQSELQNDIKILQKFLEQML